MVNSEKGSLVVEKIVDGVDRGSFFNNYLQGNKSKEDLIKASERSVKLKEVA
jgi:hypothetical protein